MRRLFYILIIIAAAWSLFGEIPAAEANGEHGRSTEQKMESIPAGADPEAPAGHYAESLTTMTENGVFSLELVPPAEQLHMGVNRLELIVHDSRGNDVAGADVRVVPWMPSMGHGVMEKPVVVERGGGVYSIRQLVFSMTGHWQLRVEVEHADEQDRAVFDFPEIAAAGHHHMDMSGMAAADTDTSTTRLSGREIYSVTYASPGGAVRINRFETWELTVRTAAGEPVENAEISVVGDMPAHGHGLPTRPAVTPTGEAGVYRVEGLKFNMPGWWVLTFHIQSEHGEDSVTFNLKL